VKNMKILERMVETRNKVRSREKRLFGKRERKILGSGTVIKKTAERADKITKRITNKKPNVIPQITEALGSWQAGQRISDAIPTGISGQKLRKTVKEVLPKKAGKRSGKVDISITR